MIALLEYRFWVYIIRCSASYISVLYKSRFKSMFEQTRRNRREDYYIINITHSHIHIGYDRRHHLMTTEYLRFGLASVFVILLLSSSHSFRRLAVFWCSKTIMQPIFNLVDPWDDWLGSQALGKDRRDGIRSYYVRVASIRVIGVRVRVCTVTPIMRKV